MSHNHQLDLIHQSATVAIADHVLSLKAQGRKIIPLQVGDPDFSTHPKVIETAIDALQAGLTHYAPSRGYLELRQAIAARVSPRNDQTNEDTCIYEPEQEILVTHGGIHAYYLAMQSILNPGDGVLIPDPSWATHSNMVKILRGTVVRVPALPENDFIPVMEAWKNALTEKSRAIVINYPANPTGVFPDRVYFKRLIDFALENDLWIVSDEVYDHLYYEEKPISVKDFPYAKNCSILVNSLSKTYAMTGWRIGYLAAPNRIINNAIKAGQNSITCIAPFIQKAAAFALSDNNVQIFTENMRRVYANRRDIVMRVYKEYGKSPIGVKPPMGAFYFFLDFRKHNMATQIICEKILKEKGVGLVPGSAFGKQGEGFIRMSIAASDKDVEDGIRAILDWSIEN